MPACCRIARLSATRLRTPKPTFRSFPGQTRIGRAAELSAWNHLGSARGSILDSILGSTWARYFGLDILGSILAQSGAHGTNVPILTRDEEIRLGGRSSTAAAVLPKNSTSPGRRLTPRT